MSDIVERLRSLRHIHLPQLSDEAAAEIERLRAVLSRTGTNLRRTCDEAMKCPELARKTPERERLNTTTIAYVRWEAERAVREFRAMDHNAMTMEQLEDYEALCELLEWLGGSK